ncbi:MAG: ZIP family metal transporter [Gaiellales bacterium]
MDANVGAVFLVALATALATGIGALPLRFVGEAGPRILGASNALAAGVMLAASAGLASEGARTSIARLLVGVVAGAVFIALVERVLDHDPTTSLGSLRGEDARKALLIMVVMTVHSIAEGVGVGSAFGDGAALGLVIGFAIALHNIPEGLAISLVLVPRGASIRAAAMWSVVSSLPQPLLAVPAFLFVEQFRSVLPAGLGFAAGAMVWMVARELIPEALAQAPARLVAGAGLLAFAAMGLVQIALL